MMMINHNIFKILKKIGKAFMVKCFLIWGVLDENNEFQMIKQNETWLIHKVVTSRPVITLVLHFTLMKWKKEIKILNKSQLKIRCVY